MYTRFAATRQDLVPRVVSHSPFYGHPFRSSINLCPFPDLESSPNQTFLFQLQVVLCPPPTVVTDLPHMSFSFPTKLLSRDSLLLPVRFLGLFLTSLSTLLLVSADVLSPPVTKVVLLRQSPYPSPSTRCVPLVTVPRNPKRLHLQRPLELFPRRNHTLTLS